VRLCGELRACVSATLYPYVEPRQSSQTVGQTGWGKILTQFHLTKKIRNQMKVLITYTYLNLCREKQERRPGIITFYFYMLWSYDDMLPILQSFV